MLFLYNKIYKNSFSFHDNTKITLQKADKILILDKELRTLNLVKVSEVIKPRFGETINELIIEEVIFEGSLINKEFFNIEFIETYTLPKDFIIPPYFKLAQLILLNEKRKTKYIEFRRAVLHSLNKQGEIYEFLTEEEVFESCVAYKENGTWGFLFYEIDKENNYTFLFEPVKNIATDGTKRKLTPSEEGYKDFVYFIFSKGHPRAIKIGRAENPEKRFASLDGSNPANISILHILPDGRQEKVFHEMFKDLNLYGKLEWFYYDENLINFIKNEKLEADKIIKKYEQSIKK